MAARPRSLSGSPARAVCDAAPGEGLSYGGPGLVTELLSDFDASDPVSQVLRVATTGKEVGFGTYETLAILGRARYLARIDRAAGLVPTGGTSA